MKDEEGKIERMRRGREEKQGEVERREWKEDSLGVEEELQMRVVVPKLRCCSPKHFAQPPQVREALWSLVIYEAHHMPVIYGRGQVTVPPRAACVI